jgi:hypothetical protein
LLKVVKTYKRKSTEQVKTLNTKVIEEMGDTLRSTAIDGGNNGLKRRTRSSGRRRWKALLGFETKMNKVSERIRYQKGIGQT